MNLSLHKNVKSIEMKNKIDRDNNKKDINSNFKVFRLTIPNELGKMVFLDTTGKK